MWKPITLEDQLLREHSKSNPGAYYLEVPLRILSETGRERRIDAVFVPDMPNIFLAAKEYSNNEISQIVQGKKVHVIEVKQGLNRGVIGQVEVAEHLLTNAMNPSFVLKTIICSRGNADLEEYCEQKGINVFLYPNIKQVQDQDGLSEIKTKERIDERQDPDKDRRGAFLAGWTDAANGHLYASIRKRKTHANMGNLFGWIYGNKPDEFKLSTWNQYIENLDIQTQLDEDL